ncbi:hypothetical protein SAMN05216466_10933 [Paraburkholderia phenazinium]|uniref:Uncharacterized protein n=1 Tax=Paraburkholderia phenazinium TaxID=60549 RepID=A0A1G8BG75_9BURK|nr:hypothetical protein SAMN05216466_10933 [Paraburkholderia phenazinium]
MPDYAGLSRHGGLGPDQKPHGKSACFGDTTSHPFIRSPPPDDVSRRGVHAGNAATQIRVQTQQGPSRAENAASKFHTDRCLRRDARQSRRPCLCRSCRLGGVCISMRPDKHLAARFKRIRLLRLACSQATMRIRIGEKVRSTIGAQVRPQARNRNHRFPVDRQQTRLCCAVPLQDRNEDRRIRDDKRITVGVIGPRPGSAYQERRSNMVDASEAPPIERVMPPPERRLPLRFCEQHVFKKNQRT